MAASSTLLPGWTPGPLGASTKFTEYNPLAPWPTNIIQSRRVQPSFGTTGITIPAPGVTGSTGVNPFTGTSLAGPGGLNPFSTIGNVKSPEIQTRIGGLLTDFDKIRTLGLGDFGAKFAAAAPQFDTLTGEDVVAASEFYNGAVQSRLDDLRKTRHAAVRGAADRALGDLTRILGLGRMGSGGGATAGPGSYITKLGLDNATGIETQAALDEAQQARADEEYQNAQRTGLLGKRPDLVQGNVLRSVLPSTVNANWLNQLLATFLPISAAQSQNNFYGTVVPRGVGGGLASPADYPGDYASALAAQNFTGTAGADWVNAQNQARMLDQARREAGLIT